MRFFNSSTKRGNDSDDAVEIRPIKWPDEPEMSASFLNRLVFLWLQPMFSRADYLRQHGKYLENDDLVPLAAIDKAEEIDKLFDEAYDNYVPKPVKGKEEGEEQTVPEREAELEKRLLHALLATVKRRLIVGGVFRFVNTVLQFSFPVLLNLILSYYEDVQMGKVTKNDPAMVYYKGYWLSALLMVFVAMKALSESAYFHKINRCSWRYEFRICICLSLLRMKIRYSQRYNKNLFYTFFSYYQSKSCSVVRYLSQVSSFGFV